MDLGSVGGYFGKYNPRLVLFNSPGTVTHPARSHRGWFETVPLTYSRGGGLELQPLRTWSTRPGCHLGCSARRTLTKYFT